jgi:hypothetical protein
MTISASAWLALAFSGAGIVLTVYLSWNRRKYGRRG